MSLSESICFCAFVFVPCCVRKCVCLVFMLMRTTVCTPVTNFDIHKCCVCVYVYTMCTLMYVCVCLYVCVFVCTMRTFMYFVCFAWVWAPVNNHVEYVFVCLCAFVSVCVCVCV